MAKLEASGAWMWGHRQSRGWAPPTAGMLVWLNQGAWRHQ